MPRNGIFVRTTFALAAAALVAALAVTSAGAAHQKRAGTLNGAGSSLIAPAVAIWQTLYKGSTVNYSAVGSGAGIAAISARTVDFGASDAPMTPTQANGCNGCVQIPWALTSTTVVVNIPGVHQGELKLTGPVVAQIYLGQIKTWNDPAITALNPGVNLPNLKITPVHRSDGSGDTYVFTNYLSKISPAWHHSVGYATTVSWPTGVGGAKNAGVAAIVGATPGTIGYVSVAYVIQNHLTMAKIKNASGNYELPTIKTIESAAQLVKSTKIPANNQINITDPPRAVSKKTKKYANAFPLSTFTYIIVPTSSNQASALKAFITWALTPAAQKAIQKDVFAPMPQVVINAAKATLGKIH